jgi:hypothetical protein
MWYGWRGIVRNPGGFAEKAWRNLVHIVRLDGLHLWLGIEEPHPAWRHAALVLLDDTTMLLAVPLFLVFVAAGARSPARSVILLWSGYYLLMVVVVFHNEIRYRSTLLPFVLAGAAGGAALLVDPAGRRRASVRGAALVGAACAAGMLAPYVGPALRHVQAAWAMRGMEARLAKGDVAGADWAHLRARRAQTCSSSRVAATTGLPDQALP